MTTLIEPHADATRADGSNRADADIVLLAGTVGRDGPWTRGLPRALLPLPGQTLIEALLRRLTDGLHGATVICANGSTDRIADALAERLGGDASLRFHRDSMPRGSAGCLKDCEPLLSGQSILVAAGSVWLEDDPAELVRRHRASGNALTVFCVREDTAPGSDHPGELRPLALYCCEPEVLRLIRGAGFQDVKEQLIPAVRQAGLRVGAETLRGASHEVLDHAGYLRALGRAITQGSFDTRGYERVAPDIWCGRGVSIAAHARVVGPALLDHHASLADGSVAVGPVLIGCGASLEKDSRLIRGVADRGAIIPSQTTVCDELLLRRAYDRAGEGASVAGRERRADGVVTETAVSSGVSYPMLGLFAGLLAAFIWAFDATAAQLWRVWQTDQDYSAGQIVPLAAAYMIYTKRDALRGLAARFWWPGAVVFALGALAHFAGEWYYYSSLRYFGMITCVNGVAISLLGRSGVARLWYPLAALYLMMPLPTRVHEAVMLPLQSASASIAASALETIGIPVVRMGHVIEIASQKIAVAEACSGLRMAAAFVIVCAVIAFLIRRPVWQRAAVLLSSIPIALACNVVRVVASAYLYHIGQAWLAEGVFHDAAGFIMIPVALMLLGLELRLLNGLRVPQGPMSALRDCVDAGKAVATR